MVHCYHHNYHYYYYYHNMYYHHHIIITIPSRNGGGHPVLISVMLHQINSSWDIYWVKYAMMQTKWVFWRSTLQWRHNECDGVSNHQPDDCSLNHLFRRRSKKTSKLRVTGFCAGNSPVNSPHKGPVTRKMFPFDDVIMKYGRCTPVECRYRASATSMV